MQGMQGSRRMTGLWGGRPTRRSPYLDLPFKSFQKPSKAWPQPKANAIYAIPLHPYMPYMHAIPLRPFAKVVC